MQQNEPWLTSAAASRLGEINIVFQPVSNEAPLLEGGGFSAASLGRKERAAVRGTHAPGSHPSHPRQGRAGLSGASALKGALPKVLGRVEDA